MTSKSPVSQMKLTTRMTKVALLPRREIINVAFVVNYCRTYIERGVSGKEERRQDREGWRGRKEEREETNEILSHFLCNVPGLREFESSVKKDIQKMT